MKIWRPPKAVQQPMFELGFRGVAEGGVRFFGEIRAGVCRTTAAGFRGNWNVSVVERSRDTCRAIRIGAK